MKAAQQYRDALQLKADLWRVPLSLCVAALLLFLATLWLDGAAARGTLRLPDWLSVGGADDARAILGAMLGAVSTVLALIFSVALLVLSMAVSQFGPRILYRFVRDGITQVTIGLFLASFVHALLTFVVTHQDETRRFIPQVTILCSVLLVVVSFGFLVVFSHRTAVSIQTQNVVARIVADLHEALAGFVAEAHRHPMLPRTPENVAALQALEARCAAEGGVVLAWRTGFVQEVDIGDLVAAAGRADAVVRLLHRPGQFVLEEAPLCQVVPPSRTELLEPAIRRDVKVGTHRTLRQDIEFALAQLVEIALRALSPAINDTFTGLTCVDWLGDAIRELATFDTPLGARVDASGTIRFFWPPLRPDRVVKAAFDQIRQSAAGNPAVQIRLLQTFARLAGQIRNPHFREPALQQVEAIWEASPSEATVKSDRADVELAYRAAREALGAR